MYLDLKAKSKIFEFDTRSRGKTRRASFCSGRSLRALQQNITRSRLLYLLNKKKKVDFTCFSTSSLMFDSEVILLGEIKRL